MELIGVDAPGDLDAPAVLEVARGAGVTLGAPMLTRLREVRDAMMAALAAGVPAYGVTTGMGALAQVPLDAEAQHDQSARLMLGRAVGGPPWLDGPEVRALLAVRLRTFLNGDAGVSTGLCGWLATLLADGALPAVPRHGSGAAGEIIPLAHAFSHLAGAGQWLGGRPGRPKAEPPPLGPKEGVALLQGVPLATALAVLRTEDVRRVEALTVRVAAAQVALVGASTDPFRAELARGDSVLASVLADLRAALPVAGEASATTRLQAPVSFRVAGPVLAHLRRQTTALDRAADRALDGVTDSPAWVPGEAGGAFVGTAGFHGLDLAAAFDGVRVALAHSAATGAARLHRMLETRHSGLPPQLSADPGPQGGLVAVHKRAVAAVHAVSGWGATPLAPAETSGGQEDVQTFALEAAERLRLTIAAAREVLACELLAVHQARLLSPSTLADAPEPLSTLLDDLAAVLPATTLDRPWGLDLQTLLGHSLLR